MPGAVQVPSDGSSLSSKALLLTSSICGTIVTLLLLVTCYVSNKAWKLRMRVSVLETSQELDMHSPLAKVLDFLKRYSKGIQIGSFVHGPSKQEASELISLVIRSSHNLALPDIQNQLEQSPELASDITR